MQLNTVHRHSECAMLVFGVILFVMGCTGKAYMDPSGQVLQATLLPKTPIMSLYNVSIALIQASDLECGQAPPMVSDDHQVLIVIGGLNCFPHQIAKTAREGGFIGAAVVYDSPFYDFNAINFWNKETHDLPVYLIPEDHVNWNIVRHLSLTPVYDNYFESVSFRTQSLIVAIINIIMAFIKMKVAFQKLKNKWYCWNGIKPVSVVVCLELITGLITIIWFGDAYGMFGIYPWWIVYSLGRMIHVFAFVATYMLWCILMSIRRKVSIRDDEMKYSAVKIFSMVLVIFIVIYNMILIYLACTRNLIRTKYLALDNLFMCLVQGAVAYSFLKNKYDLLIELEAASRSLVNNPYNFGQSAQSLGYSAIFILLYLISLAIFVLPIWNLGNQLLSWYCVGIALMSLTITGYFQVISII